MTFYLPSEWSPQSAVQLTWPHGQTDWQPWLAEVEGVYLEIVNAITRFQLVVIACHDTDIERHIMEVLSESGIDTKLVRTFVAPCDDTWARDHGPITLVDGADQTSMLDFRFNAWGDKYGSGLDDKITMSLIQQPFCHLNQYRNLDFVLEGGSIESDGKGTLLTTEKCLLNPNRNSNLNKPEIEQALIQALGVKQIIWLQHGYLAGDDTDAHIDTLARFAPNGIVYVSCDDKRDPHYLELKNMEAELQQAKDIDGKPYRLFPLPWPKPVRNKDGEQLPATYANFLVINGAVLVPVYDDPQDDEALKVISNAFPGREVIGINCLSIIEQYSSLHCLTMQLPQHLIK